MATARLLRALRIAVGTVICRRPPREQSSPLSLTDELDAVAPRLGDIEGEAHLLGGKAQVVFARRLISL